MSDRNTTRAHHPTIASAFQRFGILYVTLFFVFPLIGVFMFTPMIWSWWAIHFDGPPLQEFYGFRVEYRPVLMAGREMTLPVVASVVEGSYFALLGVQPGDVVYCNHHGEADFWGSLAYAQDGYRAHVKLVPAEHLSNGCDSYKWLEIRLEDLRRQMRNQGAAEQGVAADEARKEDAPAGLRH